ncbi:MAG: hypothetical protein JSS30_01045 [Verrucomicrobia bacterium]|nr:hypothetical protein [Verrucomicrobiota bacterium]
MPICLPVAADVVTFVQSHAAHNLVVLSHVLAQNLVHVLSHAVLSLAAQNHAVLSHVAQNHAVLSLAAQLHAHVLSLAAELAANLFVVVVITVDHAAHAMAMAMVMAIATATASLQMIKLRRLLQRSQLKLLRLVQEALTKSFLDRGPLGHRAERFA